MTRPQAMRMAREMFDEGRGGWTVAGLCDYLTQRGVPVCRSTVRHWVDPAYAARQARSRTERGNRERAARAGGRLRPAVRLTPQFKLERLRALRALRPRLSYDQIAALIEFDIGDHVSGDQVRHALDRDRYPSRPPSVNDPDVRQWIADGLIA